MTTTSHGQLTFPVRGINEARFVHAPWEQFEAHYGVDDDNEDNKQSDVKQRHHCFQYGVQDHL